MAIMASTPQPTFGSPKTGLKFLKKTLDPGTVCRGPQLWRRGGKPSSSCGPSWHIQPVKIWGFQSFEPKNLLLIQYVSGSCEARPGIGIGIGIGTKIDGKNNESSQATFGSSENSARSCGVKHPEDASTDVGSSDEATESTETQSVGKVAFWKRRKPSLPSFGRVTNSPDIVSKPRKRQGGWFLDFGPVPATWLAGSCHVRNEIEAGFLGPKIIRNRKQASRERGCWGRPVFFLRLGWCPPHDLSWKKWRSKTLEDF